jgi:DNA-binding SARP family transcriptional activator
VKWSSAFLGLAAGVLLVAPVLADPAAAALRSDRAAESAIAAPAPGTLFTTPTDGRLRGQDFAATVTGVAWPNRAIVDGRTTVATPGHRFVAFNLQLTEDASAVAPDGNDPAVTATVHWEQGSYSLPLTAINTEIAAHATQSTWTSGSAQFGVSVPNRDHDVELDLHQGSFTQSLNLWTLRRVAPDPTVIYRDTRRPTLTSSTPASTTLTMSNPSDGFSSTAQVELRSATLSYFPAPGGGGPVILPGQAMLNLIITATYPYDPNDPAGSGHYLGGDAPVPGSLLTFTPAGAKPVTATLSDSGYSTGQADDDGLFDALYSFVVPATLTSGTLTVGPGSFTGVEVIQYAAEGGDMTINIATPATMPVSFPTVAVVAQQKLPPWVKAPLPPTAAASSSALGTPPTPGGGFPIWLAVLLLVLVAGAVLVAERWRRHRGFNLSAASSGVSSGATPVVDADPPPTTAAPPTFLTEEPRTIVRPTSAQAPATMPVTPAISATGILTVNVLGTIEVTGWREVPDRRITEELLCFLVLHDSRPMSAEQIQLAIWPTGGSHEEVARKTFLTYLSTLRKCIGAEHLPDAIGAGGYRITGVESDWATFQRLVQEADSAAGPEAIGLRTQALALVRGVPFEGVGSDQYEWVANEHLHTTMTIAVAEVGLKLATELLANGEARASETAARTGIDGAPDDFDLWRIGAHAIFARGDSTALRRWLADAARHLSPGDIARIEASLPPHSDSEEQ